MPGDRDLTTGRVWTRFLLLSLLVLAAGAAVGLLGRRQGAPPSARPDAPPAAARPASPVAERLATAPEPARAAGEAGPGVLAPPVYHPRDPQEWQGMHVDTSLQAACDTSTRCGLGMACRDGRCGPCARDAECGAGEKCVLDHCVPTDRVTCRSRRECGGEALCVLSGYSDDPRGNAAMRAYCQVPRAAGSATRRRPARRWRSCPPRSRP
jgi:hypothetical protein